MHKKRQNNKNTIRNKAKPTTKPHSVKALKQREATNISPLKSGTNSTVHNPIPYFLISPFFHQTISPITPQSNSTGEGQKLSGRCQNLSGRVKAYGKFTEICQRRIIFCRGQKKRGGSTHLSSWRPKISQGWVIYRRGAKKIAAGRVKTCSERVKSQREGVKFHREGSKLTLNQ